MFDRRGQHLLGALLLAALGQLPAPPSRALGPAPRDGEFQVNSVTANIQQSSSVALDRAGNFVVAWQSEVAGLGDEIRAQRFDARGAAQGDEIAVNLVTDSQQNAPAVAMDGAGNFVIVWQSLVADNFEIRARRFDARGGARGPEFTVNTRRGESQTAPCVAMSAGGGFVVAWEAPVRGDYEIRARRFDAAGAASGGEIAVNRESAGSQRFPEVAINAAREFVVAFRSNVAGSYEIRARRFRADGAPKGDELAVNADTRDDQLAPAVALDDRGNFVVAWENGLDDSFQIRLRRFDARDLPRGSDVVACAPTTADQFAPAVAMGAQGAFVVAWQVHGAGGLDIRAQRFAASGAARGGELVVNSVSAGTQKAVALAANQAGVVILTWHSDATGNWEIAARRYGVSGSAGRSRAASPAP
jgi:hypothetical protein